MSFKKQTYVEIIRTISIFWFNKTIILRGNQKFFLKNFDKTLVDLNEQARKLMFISEISKNIIETLIILVICIIFILSTFESKNILELAPYLVCILPPVRILQQ